jgi:polyribonucleotide nucleotidyltransferase
MATKITIEWNGRPLNIEVGGKAKQADGSAWVQYGDSIVLVTVVSAGVREGIDFFPLTVEYREMTYAAGKFPQGFFKREGRPNDKEILTSRLIDRPIRPLFPDGYNNEVQIIATVLSFDGDNDPDILAIIGASAALEVSQLPFLGPVGGIKVGLVNGKPVCNPTSSEKEGSDMELTLAGSKNGVVMVEGWANSLSEEVIIEGIELGYNMLKPVLTLQEELKSLAGKPKILVDSPPIITKELEDAIETKYKEKLKEVILTPAKLERKEKISELENTILEEFGNEDDESKSSEIKTIFEGLHKKIIRNMVVNEKKRIDGRGVTDIRPIACEVDLLPCAHGSALFTRGETQALAITTLGTSSDEQRIETLDEESRKTFMLHYKFPPFSVGEVKMLRGTSRREVGHGNLAEKALSSILPESEVFPYTTRIVSEILESNGSSSMASVCSGSLSLMAAGVPIKNPVAGIAMGLIEEEGKIEIISDILGDEDHIGDMDFKVAGTRNGITAIQMDIKTLSLTQEILKKALFQAKEGRIFILDKMSETISEPRQDISEKAPRILAIQINPDKIRDIIGPGGKTIKGITEKTGVQIEVDDKGKVMIASPDLASIKVAEEIIKKLTEEVEVGKIYSGKVKKIMDFGAFVEILPGKDGLVHISQLSDQRVGSVRDVVSEGEEVTVKVIEIDNQGKVRLSRKEALSQLKK